MGSVLVVERFSRDITAVAPGFLLDALNTVGLENLACAVSWALTASVHRLANLEGPILFLGG